MTMTPAGRRSIRWLVMGALAASCATAPVDVRPEVSGEPGRSPGPPVTGPAGSVPVSGGGSIAPGPTARGDPRPSVVPTPGVPRPTASGSGPSADPGVSGDSDADELTDAFEAQWAVTDPGSRDTDGDGVRDSAEDPDGDGLGNLGEQRFGNSPTSDDTDGDGTDDGAEDDDGDGKTNGAQQDDRPLPAGLTPPARAARQDTPVSYSDGCHSSAFDPEIHPCVYAEGGTATVTIFGDSHAQHWVPALIRAGRENDWRVVVMTKSGCPSVDVAFEAPVFEGAEESCRAWGVAGVEWVLANEPDVVIVANGRGYPLLDDNGARLRGEAREAVWQDALGRTLDSMRGAAKLIVLGDTPHMKRDPAICLAARPNRISACVTARVDALDPVHDEVERQAATEHGATFVSLNEQVCSYDPCPIVVNELMMWRDENHLTATYSRELAPSVAAMISEALGQ